MGTLYGLEAEGLKGLSGFTGAAHKITIWLQLFPKSLTLTFLFHSQPTFERVPRITWFGIPIRHVLRLPFAAYLKTCPQNTPHAWKAVRTLTEDFWCMNPGQEYVWMYS